MCLKTICSQYIKMPWVPVPLNWTLVFTPYLCKCHTHSNMHWPSSPNVSIMTSNHEACVSGGTKESANADPPAVAFDLFPIK